MLGPRVTVLERCHAKLATEVRQKVERYQEDIGGDVKEIRRDQGYS